MGWLRNTMGRFSRSTYSTISVVTIFALVATLALIATGYQAQKVLLDDGAVWVVNSQKEAIGRANTKVLELNTVLSTESTQMTLLQNASDVYVLNEVTRSVDIVSSATGEKTESIPIPADVSSAALAQSQLVMHSSRTGDVWVIPVSALASFDAGTQQANFNVGADSVVSLSAQGDFAAVSAQTSLVSTLNIVRGEDIQTQRLDGELTPNALEITLVGQRWFVLDTQTATAYTAGRVIDVGGIDNLSTAILQQPSIASATPPDTSQDIVLVSHSGGLHGIELDSGNVLLLSESGQAQPAAPVVIGQCAYAAWSSGSVWSQCRAEASAVEIAEEMSNGAELIFQQRSEIVVLNDSSTGRVWTVQDGVRLIDNWDTLLAQLQEQEQIIQTVNADVPEYEQTPQPPVAVDDELGARPGRVTSLPVLINDYDPNGDALVIESVTNISASLGEVYVSSDRNSVMIRLTPQASGTAEFAYTISDGRGQQASANVTVSIRPESENSAPYQARPTRADVVAGGQLVINVLGDWIDPDGDAIFVASATVDAPDSVTFSPSGRIAYTNAGSAGGTKQVALEISDGRLSGFGSVDVSIKAVGQVPIRTEAFAVIAVAGQPTLVSPAPHVRGGNGVISLTGVSNTPGIDIQTDLANFTFTLTATRTGSQYVTYAVTDGDQTTSGLVRVDVINPPEISAPPITAAHALYVPLQQTRSVDVTETDTDPAGGVLVVTEVFGTPEDSGLQLEIVEHRLIRVTLTKPLDEPVSFGYRISNGTSQSNGSVTVVQTPTPRIAQAPVAVPDAVSVRVGDAITIPVLANDIHPDGGLLTLGSALDQNVPEEAGLLFASGSRLRFLASDRPGTYSAIYRVNADNGQWASGTLTIFVRAIDETTNQSPQPQTVTARAMSGQTIRISIPLIGIDPDGDSVQFVGLDSNPEKGLITATGGDWIEYEASAYATGTDEFTYSVVDVLGAQASATIRVGIAEPLAGGQNPVAVFDEIYARPGATVYVRPLINDSDPNGRPLTLFSVTSSDGLVESEIKGNVVTLVAPTEVGRYGLVYEIENDLAGSASNFIALNVQTEAPLNPPQITDHVVSLSDIIDQSYVDIDVLRNAFFSDGPVSSLSAELVRGYATTARVISSGVIRVDIQAQSQIIPYRVSHPEDPTITSTAFLWVPGTDDALPQRKKGVAGLTVVSEEPLRININDYVVAALGKQVRLTDTPNVRATHADGSRLVVNETTLSYTSEDRYFGPASISFEVTDGSRTATIVLPISVTPRENMPPVMLGASIDLEPGQEKTLDLVKVTRYPYVDDQDELTYTVTGAGQGISITLNGQSLTVSARDTAVKGQTIGLTVSVADLVNEGTAGTILVRIVPSTRPLPVPATDNVTIKRGETITVDVLANDVATNPFPNEPLRVVNVRGLGQSNLPEGLRVTPSADKSSLTVSVSNTAQPSDTSIEYEVADATNDSDRYVWGVVQISIQDVPDAPGAPVRAAGFVSGNLTLSWSAPASNNSPITQYVVESDAGYRKECSATVCSLDGLPTGTRARFSVTAVNGMGTSAPSAWSAPLSADVVPAASFSVSISTVAYNPTKPEGGGINISWNAVPTPSGGSAVTTYRVEVIENGSVLRGSFEVPAATTSLGPLWYTAGNSYTARVAAINDADTTQWNWATSNTVIAAGPPTSVNITSIQNASDGSSTVSWSSSEPSSGGQLRYALVTSSSPLSGPCPSNYASLPSTTSLSATDGPKATGTYSVAVYAYNAYGCVSTYALTSVVQVPGTASYASAQLVSGTLPGDFVIQITSPIVDAYATPSMTWQYKVVSAQGVVTWVTLADVTVGSLPTFEISGSQYFAAGGQSGPGQTVIIRGCASETNCGAEGGNATIDIP